VLGLTGSGRVEDGLAGRPRWWLRYGRVHTLVSNTCSSYATARTRSSGCGPSCHPGHASSASPQQTLGFGVSLRTRSRDGLSSATLVRFSPPCLTSRCSVCLLV
jgi:hypothetical protein